LSPHDDSSPDAQGAAARGGAASDESVVEQVRAGDEAAAQELFERYFPLLRARVQRRLPKAVSRKVAESDIIQEAFMGALRRLEDFQDRGAGSFGGWIRTIVDRRVTDQVRRYLGSERRDLHREVSVGGEPVEPRPPSDAPSVSSSPQRDEAVEAVLRSVEELPPADRMLLRLVHFEGQTIAHAAELMDTTHESARARYGRAVVRLQKLMRRNAPGEPR